tara:strand:+ start:2409 stop:3029 length:621 start_codon:yes stop_codon:yes gene_type:complete
MDHKNITAALAAFHGDVAVITKDSRAQYGQFADLATVLSAITPALSKNGLALVQTFDLDDGGDVLVTTLYHTSGEQITSRARLVHVEGAGGRQNPLHLWGGSVTYQRRYAALALVGLAAGMEDDDGDIADPPPRKVQAKKVTPEKVTPINVEGWDSREHAEQALDLCANAEQLKTWATKTAASGFQGLDRDELVTAYKERAALMEA